MVVDSSIVDPTHVYYFVSSAGKSEENILIQQFGSSKEFIKSAAHVVGGNGYSANDITPFNFIEAATQVANCEYECGTFWGKQVHNRKKRVYLLDNSKPFFAQMKSC